MLKDFCIGDSLEYVSAEYAKSGRSTCKTCKQKIGQDELRIGLLVDDDHFSTGQGTQWYHKGCFHFKPRHRALEVNELNKKIYGLQNLKKKDQKDVLTYLKSELTTIKQGKPKKKTSQKSKSKPKVEQKKQEKKEQTKQPAKQQTKRVLRSRSIPAKKVESSTQEEKTKKRKKSVKAKKQKKFLSSDQQKEYLKLLTDCYNHKGLNQLKDILQKNNQTKTGTKIELAAKCADGKQFGRIPMCSKCGGGKLRFDRDKGTYTCPGYMEDTDFKHCNTIFSFDEIKRLEWIQ